MLAVNITAPLNSDPPAGGVEERAARWWSVTDATLRRLGDEGAGRQLRRKRHALTRDAELLGEDASLGAAEVLPVVVRYPRYDSDDGVHEIRRVEPPAEPHFEHGRVDRRLEKIPCGDRSEALEIGQPRAARMIVHHPDEPVELARGNLAAVDADSLVRTEDMRRVVGADLEPPGGEHGGDVRQAT